MNLVNGAIATYSDSFPVFPARVTSRSPCKTVVRHDGPVFTVQSFLCRLVSEWIGIETESKMGRSMAHD